MPTRFYGETTLAGFSANIDEDVRVIRDIERKARELHGKLDLLEDRWTARTDKLEHRRIPIKGSIIVAYDFRDIFS